MLRLRKNEAGFTLIELLIVVVIIGILAAVGVPIYSRYIMSARMSEAPTIVNALREYAQSYMRAHPTAPGGGPLGTDQDCGQNGAAGTDGSSTDWVNEVVGTENRFFSYSYTAVAAATPGTITATALADLGAPATADTMTYDLATNAWATTDNGGDGDPLADVMPD